MTQELLGSFREVQSKMNLVEAAQEKRLGADAMSIFDEKKYVEKVAQKQRQLTSLLKDAKLSQSVEEQVLKSKEMKTLLSSMDRMKSLSSSKESLQVLGRKIEEELLHLFDQYAKEKIASTSDTKPQLETYWSSLKGIEAYSVPFDKKEYMQVQDLYGKIVQHQQTAREALKVWNHRQLVPLAKGYTATDDPREHEKIQLQEAYTVVKTLRPSTEIYEGMKYLQRTYPKKWLQGMISGLASSIRQELFRGSPDKKKLESWGQKMKTLVQELKNFEKNPKVLPNSFLKQFPEAKNALYSDDLKKLKDVMKNIPGGILEGVKETAHSLKDMFVSVGKELVLLPSVATYAMVKYKGDTRKVLEEMGRDTKFGACVKTIMEVSSTVKKDPKGSAEKLYAVLKVLPAQFGPWWEALTPEEKGTMIGKLLSNALPVGTAVGIIPKAAVLVKETALLKRTMDVLHTSFYLKGAPMKWEAKALQALLLKEIEVVGPGFIEKSIYAPLKKAFPGGYGKFFEEKTGLLNAEVLGDAKAKAIIEQAGFRFMGMIDVGGVGTENAIFGAEKTNERFTYIRNLAKEAEKRGAIVLRLGGDEYGVFSKDPTFLQTIQKKMNSYQKTLDPKKVKEAHNAEYFKQESKQVLKFMEEKIAHTSIDLTNYESAQKTIFDLLGQVFKADEIHDIDSFTKAFPKAKFTTEELARIKALESEGKNIGTSLAKEWGITGGKQQELEATMSELSVYIFLKQRMNVAPKSNFGMMYTVYDRMEGQQIDGLLQKLEQAVSLRKKGVIGGKKSYTALSSSPLEKLFMKKKDTGNLVHSPHYTSTGSLVPEGSGKEKLKVISDELFHILDRTQLGKPAASLLPKGAEKAYAIGFEMNVGAYNNMTKFAESGTTISNDLIMLSRQVVKDVVQQFQSQGKKVQVQVVNEGGTFTVVAPVSHDSTLTPKEIELLLQKIVARAESAQKEFLKDLVQSQGKKSKKALVDKTMSSLSKSFANVSAGKNPYTSVDAFQKKTEVKLITKQSKESLKQLIFS